MPPAAYLDSTLYLTGLNAARFSWGGREYLGEPALDEERAQLLASLELEPEAYGRELYDTVFPPGSELREGLREAVLAAEEEKSRLRFQLHLATGLPEWAHALYWELLTDFGRHLALARSPDTAFSRYLGVRQAPGTPTARRPRLLCVVAAPSDIGRFNLAEIHRDEVARRLEAPFSMLAAAADVEILEPPATLEKLRQRLMADGGFHLLHFFGHGHNRNGVSALVLEDDQGRTKFVEEELLAEVFLGVRELRLVTLIACHGGAPSSRDPFSGLAGRLVQRGVPAVVAMRREVSVETAHLFTNHLYTHITQTGRADAAVNEARQQLYLADPRGIAWSSPVLYSRLTDGRLWLPREAPEEETTAVSTSDPRLRISFRRLRHPLAWVPALLWLALVILGVWPAADAEARLDLQVSELAFRLARSGTVIERLRLKDIAATQLAAVRLPSVLPSPSQWLAGGTGGMKGFFLAAQPAPSAGAQITLNTLPLPAGAKVVFEHQGGSAYRLSFAGLDQELRVTFQGDVVLNPLDGPPAALHLKHPESIVLYPQSDSVDIDATFASFAQDEVAPEIPIDRLALYRVVEQHSAKVSMVREESTLIAGEVQVRATGERHRLKKDELLRFSTIAGSLARLRLGEDGIHLGFQGRVSELMRVTAGLQPESLMPSVLDLWIPGPMQPTVLAAFGAVVVVVLFLTALYARPRSRSRPCQPAGEPITQVNP